MSKWCAGQRGLAKSREKGRGAIALSSKAGRRRRGSVARAAGRSGIRAPLRCAGIRPQVRAITHPW